MVSRKMKFFDDNFDPMALCSRVIFFADKVEDTGQVTIIEGPALVLILMIVYVILLWVLALYS